MKNNRAIWRMLSDQYAWYFYIAIFLVVLILTNFSDETVYNTERITGVVTDVEFCSARGSWLEFKIGGVNCCYVIADANNMGIDRVTDSYKHLEASGKTVTAITTDKFSFCPGKGLRVVGVVGEKGDCFSVASHNKRQLFVKMALCIGPALMALLALNYKLFVVFNEIIIPAHKRKKRREEKQIQKAKFATQQTTKQEQATLKRSKRNSRKK